MGQWNFLTNHARALLCVARDPGVRLRDIAGTVGISERRAFGIVSEIRHHLPLREAEGRERTIGELLELLASAEPEAKERT